MIRTLLPADPVARALSFATMSAAFSSGLFYSVSALFFTRVIGLSATTVGLGLSVAGAVGVLASFLGGRLSDRFGADRVQVVANGLQGLALLAYVLADDTTSFVAIACCAVGFRALQGSAKATMLARWFTGPDRVQVRARLRVVTNVFIGLGTVLAGLALLVGSAAAYRTTMVIAGVLALAATLPLTGLRQRIPDLAVRMRRPVDATGAVTVGRSPLRDRTYVASVALNSVMALQFGLQNVGIPLWIAGHTEAPTVMISALMVVNTVFVALAQVRASRGTHDVLVAGRTVRRAGLLLGVACLLYAAAGSVGVVLAVVVLLAAELVASAAEVWSEAGGWGLAFELADPVNAGAYQGLSQMGYSLAGMLAPAVVTVTAIEHGAAGWAVLGAGFAVTGVLVARLAAHAAATRPAVPVELVA
ncbi:MFS transporter [Nocardioides ferulae]|uniref:MFS transporter n=1 Tax=Nocardioides ferulae TaxID=2340821 RepID=UPI000EB362CA|nr:MFS transporter [Nocardioides ferulae]